MPRFLLTLALLTATAPLLAQEAQRNQFALEYGSGNPYSGPAVEGTAQGPSAAPWSADLAPNRRYPVFIHLTPETFLYDGVSYSGTAHAHIFQSAHAGENLTFHYCCGASFTSGEYYARWNPAATHLDIHIRNPRTNETRSCHMKLLASATP